MKTGKIILLIVWILIAITIAAMLVGFITGKGIFGKIDFGNGSTKFTYSNADAYSVGNGAVPADRINHIEINWINGSVELKEYDGSDIKFEENILSSEEEKLRYITDGKNLIIQFCKSGVYTNLTLSKTLTVYVPTSAYGNILSTDISSASANISLSGMRLADMKLSSVSGKIMISDAVAGDVKADSVSGSVTVTNTSASEVEIDTTSGSIDFEGSAEKIDVDSVSGSIKLTLGNCPQKIDCDTTSGKVTVILPDNDGFTAKLDTVSGNIETNFSCEISRKRIVYKNGGADFEFDTVSGDVVINKK